VIGDVDAVGDGVTGVQVGDRVGALTVTGGYTEVLYWRADRLIPVPTTVDPAAASTIILNYIVAYQSMHRNAHVKQGDKVLIVGASGGIGTALMQLGKLAGLKMYGLASESKHDLLRQMDVTPIDYRMQDFVEVLRDLEPGGLDAVFDGMSGDYIQRGLDVLGRGGTLVSFGEPPSLRALFGMLGTMITTNLLPNGRAFKFYGTSFYFLGRRRPFNEDWAELFRLLDAGAIAPVIDSKYPILEAAQANARLESGRVIGNVVLVTRELM
jgi:NADPH:quinone reductase-like Zn-dependent oxidoreductase